VTNNLALEQITAYQPSPSEIQDHGAPCCRAALAWLRGVDASRIYRDGNWHPPAWLRKEYDWGPLAWPLYWCQLLDVDQLDCGALACIAVKLYSFRGVLASPVQLALRYPHHAAEQWSRLWAGEAMDAGWIAGGFCYHAACGVMEGDELRLWDPSSSRWRYPPASPAEAFASVVAIKVTQSAAEVPAKLRWEGLEVRSGEWQRLVTL